MSDRQISRLLVGVDSDDSSAAALRVAGTMARALGATLTAVHAHSVEVPAYFTGARIRAEAVVRTATVPVLVVPVSERSSS